MPLPFRAANAVPTRGLGWRYEGVVASGEVGVSVLLVLWAGLGSRLLIEGVGMYSMITWSTACSAARSAFALMSCSVVASSLERSKGLEGPYVSSNLRLRDGEVVGEDLLGS